MSHMKFDEKSKIWSTIIPPAFNPTISIGHILLRSLKLNGRQIAQINDDTGEQLSFEAIRIKTIRAAVNLQARGIRSEQVFGIFAGNVAHLFPIVFASMCIGCPINPLYIGMEKSEIIRTFENTKPTVVFCDVKVYDLLEECLKELNNNAKIFTFNGRKGVSEPVENLFNGTESDENFVPVEIDGINHIAAIMCSSGTVGESKDISLSHANLITRSSYVTSIATNDIVLNFSSLHWITGLTLMLAGTINGATRIMTTESVSPEMQLRIIQKYKVTHVVNQAYFLVELLKSGLLPEADLSSVRHMFIGGAAVPLSIRDKFNSYLPNGCTNNAYGLTEMAGSVAQEYPDYAGTQTVGRLLDGFMLKIINIEGKRCDVDTIGDICVKGMQRDDDLTEVSIDSEGFFITGDIGFIDKNGYLFILERRKDLINYIDWVSPSKIEEILIESCDIRNACVVGIPFGPVLEVPAAVIVRAEGSNITHDDIYRMVEDNMSDYHKLRGGVYFVDSIPVTSTGKPLRRVVRDLVIKWIEEK